MEKQRWEESEKRREEKRREEKRKIKKIKEEKVRRKKMQVRENVGKSQWFVAPEGRKVGSLKRRVRSHLARWEMKNCTPLWREAHVEVKMYKTPPLRSTFRSCDVEKVHAVVARSTCPSQNVQNTVTWPLLEVDTLKKCTPLWQEADFKVKSEQTTEGSGALLDVQMSFLRGRQKGLCTLSRVNKTKGFCSSFENDGRCGTFEQDLQRCIFRGRRKTRDMFIRDVRRSGRWFPERGCTLEHEIIKFAKMILRDLRDRCRTSCDLASLLRGRRSTLDRWIGKNRKTHWCEAVSSATQLSIFEGSLAELLRFWWLLNFKNWRSLAGLLALLMLPSWKIEDVSRNSFVFKLANR